MGLAVWFRARNVVFFGFLVAAMVAVSLLVVARPAHAVSTFTVNTTLDTGDATPDGVCDSNPHPFVISCSLREAIQEANAAANSGGPDLIKFSIFGPGPHTIAPGSELPDISQPVTIDGYTEGDGTASTADDATENTAANGTNAVLLIELNGENAGDANGFTITGGGTTIRGLVINRFKQEDPGAFNGCGIFLPNLAPNTNNVIEGNFIGTDTTGTQDLGNELPGVLSFNQSINNRIGGPELEDRNLISGNQGDGVGADSSDNTVQNNLIGTDKGGTADLGNGGNGVEVAGTGNLLTDNTIAFNGKDGFSDGVAVFFDTSTGNDILKNSIFSNTGLGIDLAGGSEDASGATANAGGTADDSDTGPNGLQNKPTLTSATTTGTTISIAGRFDTKPNKTFKVEFFSQPGGNEGKKFIGAGQVTTDDDGRVPFSFQFNKKVAVGQKITAAATRSEGTSEFSAPRAVTAS